MTVRDCDDLNKYGVVNDAMYASYIEKAREEMFASFGLCISSIARTGRAIARTSYTLCCDKFVVMVRIAQIKGVRTVMESFIETLPERKIVLEATVTGVCLDKDYRPTRVYPEMSEMLEFFSDPRNDPGKLQ
ncbi:hypothetical protein EJB05_45345 [Eragrostis curvula]|uniref:Thioesterase domain-containing protein n=1 Tax=Eragrostis curvula TaxID=38414 RepID=A0A5J9TJZ5_9POAL|nr:hypothetical protein EJB05_45345 [Eragrostis curvula]